MSNVMEVIKKRSSTRGYTRRTADSGGAERADTRRATGADSGKQTGDSFHNTKW